MYNLDNYINFLKDKLERKFFSPLIIKLANLYFLNEQYDDCIKLCKILSEVYPFYLTPNILKIKALIKLEYFSEAENVLKLIEQKIPNKELTDSLHTTINEFKKHQGQAKIFYSEMISDLEKFNDYEKLFSDIKHLDELPEEQELILIDNDYLNNSFNSDKFKEFANQVKDISLFEFKVKKESKNDNDTNDNLLSSDSLLGNVKIVTESIADVFVKQGLYKEAFDAYTLLLRAGHKNKKRILDKISELERRM